MDGLKGRRRQSGIVLATALLCVLLFIFPPERYGWYPRCPFHEWTGWLCPGCGGTRAVAALLHGRWTEAWRCNALVVILAPGFLVYAGTACWRRGAWPRVPSAVVWSLVGVAVGYGVMRNLW